MEAWGKQESDSVHVIDSVKSVYWSNMVYWKPNTSFMSTHSFNSPSVSAAACMKLAFKGVTLQFLVSTPNSTCKTSKVKLTL